MNQKIKLSDTELSRLNEAMDGLKYGYVQIVVQDSKIVQIDRLEKFRLDRESEASAKG